MYIDRIINIKEKYSKKSLFLIGPRQTGKSSLLATCLPEDTPQYSLLDKEFFFKVSANLGLIREQIRSRPPKDKLVVIDEIQKLPDLLDEVHLMIEQDQIRFILTGSSARKLKAKGVNLLGGRAREQILHPFVFAELTKEHFDLRRALNRGLIPAIYLSDSPRDDQRSYIGSYLQIEIGAEARVRDLPAFSRFLAIAALCNGQIINYSSIANDANVNRKIVSEYFQILFDTLIAYELPAWKLSKKRKPIETSKFYFFDIGIARAILDLPPTKEKSKDFGDAFEAYIFHELKTYIDYNCPATPLNFWRSTSNYEVDFIMGNSIAVEVKAKKQVSQKDLDGLRACAEEHIIKKYFVVSLEEQSRIVDEKFHIIPYQDFLTLLWQHELLPKAEAI